MVTSVAIYLTKLCVTGDALIYGIWIIEFAFINPVQLEMLCMGSDLWKQLYGIRFEELQ